MREHVKIKEVYIVCQLWLDKNKPSWASWALMSCLKQTGKKNRRKAHVGSSTLKRHQWDVIHIQKVATTNKKIKQKLQSSYSIKSILYLMNDIIHKITQKKGQMSSQLRTLTVTIQNFLKVLVWCRVVFSIVVVVGCSLFLLSSLSQLVVLVIVVSSC